MVSIKKVRKVKNSPKPKPKKLSAFLDRKLLSEELPNGRKVSDGYEFIKRSKSFSEGFKNQFFSFVKIS